MSTAPALGFFFKVEFTGSGSDVDTQFMELSGLEAQLEMESYSEAGQNSIVYQLPLRTKIPNLVLKRGLPTSANSAIVNWANDAIYNFNFAPKNITITLHQMDDSDKKNVKKVILKTWNLKGANPVKIQYSGFNAMQAAIVIETLELNYLTLTTS